MAASEMKTNGSIDEHRQEDDKALSKKEEADDTIGRKREQEEKDEKGGSTHDEHGEVAEPSRKRQKMSLPEPVSNNQRTEEIPSEKTTQAKTREQEETTKTTTTTTTESTTESENPPLPPGPPPEEPPSDGWEAIWDANVAAYYFFNHYTGVTTWNNPRVPPETTHDHPQQPTAAPGTTPHFAAPGTTPNPIAQPTPGGYNPAIHGDYDPNADYAQQYTTRSPSPPSLETTYAATAAFNRFTGKFQPSHLTADAHTDEAKSKRQMEAFFDVDAAANSHNGKSLKAERQAKKLTKNEIKAFKEKRKEKKEEKRRAWLKD